MSASSGEIGELERRAAELEECWHEAYAHVTALSEPQAHERSAAGFPDIVRAAAEKAEATAYREWSIARARLASALAGLEA